LSKKIRILYPNYKDFDKEMDRIGVDKYAYSIFQNKKETFLIKINDLKIEAANIIKQDCLAEGADAVIPRNAISGKPKKCNVIIISTKRKINRIASRFEKQPFSLKKISKELKNILKKHSKSFNFRGKKIQLKTPKVMGILNVTPDSFYDGGKYTKKEIIKKRVEQIIKEGADIIDLGAESTRPGSERVNEEEELQRLAPALEIIKKIDDRIPVSIDTYKSKIAEQMLKNGADIINDISGFNFDENMPEVVSNYNAGIILMHIKGTPKNMQKNPQYEDVIEEIYTYFKNSIQKAIKYNINRKNIIIDPGIGFGKRLENNTEIIRRLKEFASLGYPVLIGLSRKSFIGKITGRPVEDRLTGTISAHTISLMNGANIIRAHDVKEARETIDMVKEIL